MCVKKRENTQFFLQKQLNNYDIKNTSRKTLLSSYTATNKRNGEEHL